MRTTQRIRPLRSWLRRRALLTVRRRLSVVDVTAEQNAELRDSITRLFAKLDLISTAMRRGERDEVGQLWAEYDCLVRLLRALDYFSGKPPMATTVVVRSDELWAALQSIFEHSQESLALEGDAIKEIDRHWRTLCTVEQLRSAAGLARLDHRRGW